MMVGWNMLVSVLPIGHPVLAHPQELMLTIYGEIRVLSMCSSITAIKDTEFKRLNKNLLKSFSKEHFFLRDERYLQINK